jgi:sec-independent protein translocase protein TatC
MDEEQPTMGFLQHLEELRDRVQVCLIAFIIIFAVVYMLSIRSVEWEGWTIYYLWPDFYNNIPAQLFDQFKADLLPPEVVLLNIGGIDALVVNVKIGMFMAFAFCTPVFAWQAGKFFMPALYPHERRFLAGIIVPSTVLFTLGALFSYFFFTPWAMEFFFTFSDTMGIERSMAVTKFLSWIFLMILAFGLIFELPIFMAALAKLGIVGSATWKKNWRYAIVAFVIIGGIITPDVSGVTQIIVAVPMTGLYAIGIIWAVKIEKKEAERERLGL